MSHQLHEKAYWIGFNRVAGVGPARLASLIDVVGSIDAAWRASIQQLQMAGFDRRTIENLLTARRQLDLAEELSRIERAGVHVLTWNDASYPVNLRQIDVPPPVLYLYGQLADSDRWAAAIVGTRRASMYGREVAHQISSDLAQRGVTVVSGLALGIDTVAHRSALEAGGRTIAVLGSGVDQIYPAANRNLAQQIIKQGAIISEYPLGTRPDARNFPPRNRVISGLSKGTIVVEAGERSGALITASFALEQGREVFAVPGNILNPGSVGCNTLIQQGATPVLSVKDVLFGLGLDHIDAQRSAQQSMTTDPDEARLLAFLSSQPCHIDDIVRESSLPLPHVASLLTMMELKGLVRQMGAMMYVRG